ncbi:MAG: hypothetical protein AB2401_03600 [Bacillus sp. (in: firmicutes)]
MSEQNKIDEIKEALAAATPGPWIFQDGHYGKKPIVYREADCALICSLGNHGLDDKNGQFIAKSPEYITYLLQEIERLQGEVVFWKEAADNQKDNNMKLISVIHEKDEKAREAIKLWETASTLFEFDDFMHAVIDELKDSLAL